MCRLNAYLKKILAHFEGLCKSCNTAETVEHFLLHFLLNDHYAAISTDADCLAPKPKVTVTDRRCFTTEIDTVTRYTEANSYRLAGAAPAYLADDCCLLSDAGRRPLRSNSNDMRKPFVPRTHNKLGDRSFSAAGPRLWNDLPPGLRRLGLTFDSFEKSLKTHLFGDRSA